MKYLAVVLFLFFSSGTIAQEIPVNSHCSILQAGDIFNFGEVSVLFKEVISDSRCPKEVTCIWAGEAKVLLAIYENGKFLEDRIVTASAGNLVQLFSAAGITYSFSGIDLLPYPKVQSKNIKPEYTLRLSLSKK